MAKKIVIGLVITAVLSLTAFGAVYAYQKEKVNLEKNNAGKHGAYNYSNGNQTEECLEKRDPGHEEECLKNEERVRNNFRYREEECDEHSQVEANRHEHQHRYENECNEDCEEECEESEKSFQNLKENSNKQNRGRNN